VLLNAVAERLGPDAVAVDHRCAGLSPDADGVTVHFVNAAGQKLPDRRASIVIGCDGVHSAVRKHLYPNESAPRYHGTNLWRGVTRHKPFLTGASIARIGAMHSTLIVYPIRQELDEHGLQLMNWVAEVDGEVATAADWNARGKLDDFLPVYKDWHFDWLDVPELLKSTDPILAYPMVDRDPLDRWTFGRITLLGDAAHPMFPRGGNGGAQAILDTVSLARHLAATAGDTTRDVAALSAYEDERRPATSKVVLQNRTAPPNLIVDTVEKRTGGKPFNSLEEVVTQDELKTIFANYQKVAGYHVDLVNKQGSTK
jgi:2-polyprenyl-6-methoxyphenol hydroxylase-like FAD-dependent oxidoreductase